MMKQTRLDQYFNIKIKERKNNKNPTPYNTPELSGERNEKIMNGFKLLERLEKEKPKYLLRFDGASKGNPGIAGAGAVLYKNNKEIWNISRNLGNQTNNYAECFAVILGITEACNRGIKDLEVEGDSMLIINQLKGKWKVKNNDLKVLYLSICQTLKQFENIRYRHIYRNKNKRADELANIGCKMNR